jgi:hypothetical protein
MSVREVIISAQSLGMVECGLCIASFSAEISSDYCGYFVCLGLVLRQVSLCDLSWSGTPDIPAPISQCCDYKCVPSHVVYVYFYLFLKMFGVLVIKPRASHMLGRCSLTELYS